MRMIRTVMRLKKGPPPIPARAVNVAVTPVANSVRRTGIQ